MNETISYYNKNAENFIKDTVSVDFEKTQNKFLDKLPPNAYILDFGCGSGRDTKFFLNLGYMVDAIDGSDEFVKYASDYTGIKVKKMLFQELNAKDCYDGIWACSSILHLTKSQLKSVFEKMAKALKHNGFIYTSFKYGNFEGMRNGRHFTDFTMETFTDFMNDISSLNVLEYWITSDVRDNRSDKKWLNLILQKSY